MSFFRPFVFVAAVAVGIVITPISWEPHGHSHDGWLSSAHAAQQYTCGMHPMVIVDEPGDCPICGMDLIPLEEGGGDSASVDTGDRKIKYWVAPMDPTYIRDEPGKSPMGMDLVPVYEDEATGGTIVKVDPVTAQNMGVRTALVERRDLQRHVRTLGIVDYAEPQQFSINTKISGWVERLYVNETGQQVKKGQALLEIYSPELVTAQEEYILALENYDAVKDSPFSSVVASAERLLKASRNRLAFWDISDRQIRSLAKSREAKRNLTIYAPYNGIVNKKSIESGMFVKGGMELFKISDISSVWVQADIYEYELPWVKVGQKADVILPFVGGKTVAGTISYIYPYIEPKTRTVKARIELDNSDYELKPEMYVNVLIQANAVENALSIPVEAVLHSGDQERVFIALGGGKFEPRRVKTGVQDEDGFIEIVQGVMPGEQVVTSAQFMFDSESKLREAISKMMEPKKANPAPTSSKDEVDDLFGDDEKPAKKEDLDDLF